MSMAERIIERFRAEFPKASAAGLDRLKVIIDEEEKAAKKERKKASIAEDAAKVYDLYPKKVARDDALVAITKALKVHPLDYLMDKTSRFAECVKAWPSSYRYFQDGGDRCPHGASFFNSGRFQDDEKEWRRAGARSAPARPVTPIQQKMTAEQEEEDRKALERYLAMPEPEKGTLQHSLWVEAHRTAAVEKVVSGATETVLAEEDRQRLRHA